MPDLKASEKIGAFVASVRSEQIPQDTVHRTARAFVDTYAVTAAGRDDPGSHIVRDYALATEGAPRASIWTTPHRVGAEYAALANSFTGHVLDYDDVSSPLRGHPSVVMLPALVAMGEVEGSTGCQISAAYAVGFEVTLKLGRALSVNHYLRGWHNTSVSGVIGAAAACSHLLRLDADRSTAAVGIAVAQASGVLRSFGTMSKSIQPANAAMVAIRSARLAAAGFTAPPDSLDGPCGFLHAYGSGDGVQEQLDSLGQEPLELIRAGIEVKKYPCCYAGHRAIQGTLDLMAERPIPISEVERVRVVVQTTGLAPLIHSQPITGLEAKFSMQYHVAAALLDGAVGLSSFTDEAVQRPEAQSLLRKVEPSEDPDGAWPRRALVEIELRSGERRSIRVDELRGGAKFPLTQGELEAKLRDCVAYSKLEMDADRFLSAVWDWGDRPIRSVLEAAAVSS